MKKLLSVITVFAIMAMALVSCEKSDNGDGGKEDNTIKARVTSFSLVGDGWADVYQYSYDDSGKVIKVYRDEEKQWNFAYQGDEITVTKADGAVAYAMTLGANGFISEMTDEWAESRTYKYDSNGQMIQTSKLGEVKSNITIQDKCIAIWSKWRDDIEVFKAHTFMTTANSFGIHNIYSEATDPSRWLYETGLFGKPSAYLCETSKWDYSDTTATYEYEFDDNGCPIKENKNYGGDMEYFEYTWELLK